MCKQADSTKTKKKLLSFKIAIAKVTNLPGLRLAIQSSSTYIRVIHHFSKQSQNDTAFFNVFQDFKSKISEKSDQN